MSNYRGYLPHYTQAPPNRVDPGIVARLDLVVIGLAGVALIGVAIELFRRYRR